MVPSNCAILKRSNIELIQRRGDLLMLSFSLNWAHDAGRSFSVAFLAPPEDLEDWFLWAIIVTGSSVIRV